MGASRHRGLFLSGVIEGPTVAQYANSTFVTTYVYTAHVRSRLILSTVRGFLFQSVMQAVHTAGPIDVVLSLFQVPEGTPFYEPGGLN